LILFLYFVTGFLWKACVEPVTTCAVTGFYCPNR
jgi:hypothetical protein